MIPQTRAAPAKPNLAQASSPEDFGAILHAGVDASAAKVSVHLTREDAQRCYGTSALPRRIGETHTDDKRHQRPSP